MNQNLVFAPSTLTTWILDYRTMIALAEQLTQGILTWITKKSSFSMKNKEPLPIPKAWGCPLSEGWNLEHTVWKTYSYMGYVKMLFLFPSHAQLAYLTVGQKPEWECLLSADKTSEFKIWTEFKGCSSACSAWVPWVGCFSKSYSLLFLGARMTAEGLMISCKQ